MNTLRRMLGPVWMLLGPTVLVYLLYEAGKKISQPTSTANDVLQWSIILLILVPIVVGLVIFGYYAYKGEYDVDPSYHPR